MAAYATRVRQLPGGWSGECARPCGFRTSGWATRKLATARIDQHAAEHDGGKPAPELSDFRIAQGVQDKPAGLTFDDEGA